MDEKNPGKGARAIHQSGKWYTDENMDLLLMEHRPAKNARRSGKHLSAIY